MRADVAVGSDGLAAAGADGATGSHGLLDLGCHGAGLLERHADDDVWRVVLSCLDIVDEDGDVGVGFVVTDGDAADLEFGRGRWDRANGAGVDLDEAGLGDAGRAELGDHLFEGEPERLELLLLEPEHDGVELVTEDHSEAALPRNADRFRLGPRNVVKFMSLKCHALRPALSLDSHSASSLQCSPLVLNSTQSAVAWEQTRSA